MAQEKNFENKIKDFLKSHDCYFVKYFANRMTKAGIPDILASVNGHFVGIEVKATNGHPSELQLWNVKQIQKSGGFALILYPEYWEDFKTMISVLLDDEVDNARIIEQRVNSKFF